MLLLNLISAFVLLRFFVTLSNFLSRPRLRNLSLETKDPVSILIPARNEGNKIIRLLESIEKEGYAQKEVIVLDDQSTDNTAQLAKDWIKGKNGYKLIQGKGLEHGWTGKNWACYQLAQEAKGKYWLFLDADMVLAAGVIKNSIRVMRQKHLSLFSLYPNRILHHPVQRLITPLYNYILLSILPLRVIYQSRNPAFAYANGQYMMFSAFAYKKYQWHKQVHDRIAEDLEIARLVRERRLRSKTYLAGVLAQCHVDDNFRDLSMGFRRVIFAAFGYNALVFSLFLLFMGLGYLLVLPWLSWPVILIHAVLILSMRFMIGRMCRENIFLNTLAHPVQIFLLHWLGLMSMIDHYGKRETWKGRRVVT